ncbi:hypothetical protein C8J56DRAFT_413914 [Mycena floridula]|nr:hypothetical protein C8J56DRAFT_413914 [Mycena floridula]
MRIPRPLLYPTAHPLSRALCLPLVNLHRHPLGLVPAQSAPCLVDPRIPTLRFLTTLGCTTLLTLLVGGGWFIWTTQQDKHPGKQLPFEERKKTLVVLDRSSNQRATSHDTSRGDNSRC